MHVRHHGAAAIELRPRFSSSTDSEAVVGRALRSIGLPRIEGSARTCSVTDVRVEASGHVTTAADRRRTNAARTAGEEPISVRSAEDQKVRARTGEA